LGYDEKICILPLNRVDTKNPHPLGVTRVKFEVKTNNRSWFSSRNRI